jgi:hypothetical protein
MEKKEPKQNKNRKHANSRGPVTTREDKIWRKTREEEEEENTAAVARLQAERTGSACGQQQGSRVRDCDRTGRQDGHVNDGHHLPT